MTGRNSAVARTRDQQSHAYATTLLRHVTTCAVAGAGQAPRLRRLCLFLPSTAGGVCVCVCVCVCVRDCVCECACACLRRLLIFLPSAAKTRPLTMTFLKAVCVCARARERVCTRPLTMTLLQAACEKKLYDSLVLK